MKLRTKLAALTLSASLLLAGCSDFTIVFDSPSQSVDGEAQIHFLDVGQADSALIVCGDDTILIDGGERGDGDFVVDYIRSLGIDQLDLVIATHPHEDHIGGLPDVLEAFPVDELYMSDLPATTKIYETLLDSIDEQELTPECPEVGESISFDSGMAVTVLAPGPDNAELSKDANSASVSVRVDIGAFSAVFTGDATTKSEKQMLESRLPLACDVYKVAHHGSRTSNSEAFIQALSPELAVVSVGEYSEYGLPDEEPLERLEAVGAEILQTIDVGTVVVTVQPDGSYSYETER
ncbi:MAG: ComEC/Rec2 family competence protein [Butyricicoccaceae bacterium]